MRRLRPASEGVRMTAARKATARRVRNAIREDRRRSEAEERVAALMREAFNLVNRIRYAVHRGERDATRLRGLAEGALSAVARLRNRLVIREGEDRTWPSQ